VQPERADLCLEHPYVPLFELTGLRSRPDHRGSCRGTYLIGSSPNSNLVHEGALLSFCRALRCLAAGQRPQQAPQRDRLDGGVGKRVCVPRTLSTSGDQAVFVDHAPDASVSPDVVSLKVDRFG
jgi:hypothetical protein